MPGGKKQTTIPLTDLGSLGAPNSGAGQLIHGPMRAIAQKLELKDSYIGFGPTDIFNSTLKHERHGRYRGINVAPGDFPMLSQPAIKAISGAHTDRDAIFADAIKSDVLEPAQKEMLRNIGDKKVLTVLGSGRGDYTALRTQELAEAIKQRGLQNKIQLITMLGEVGAKNPLSKNLAQYPNLLALQGKLPQNLYVGLPSASHMIDASTGTSSLFESLASPAKVVMRDSWNPIKQRELTALDNPDLWKNWTRSTHGGLTQQLKPVNLDAWNHGNRNVAAGLPEVSRVHTADEILDSLMGGHGVDEAAARGRAVLQASEAGTGNLRAALGGLLERQNMFKNLRGVGQMALGTGLAAMPWWRRHDSPLRFN